MALIQYNNEYKRLKKVALYKPALKEIWQQDTEDAMYIEAPNPQEVLREFDGVVDALKSFGVEVVELNHHSPLPLMPNMIFLRDVACAFRHSLILARMKYHIREQEPEKFKQLLIAYDLMYEAHIKELPQDVSMEGADIFVHNNDTLCMYVGNRTSQSAAVAFRAQYGAEVATIKANIFGVPQHILGGVHLLSKSLATRRTAYCQDRIKGYEFIDFEEDEEISNGFALNIVTIAPNEILMPAGNHRTKQRLEANGIICHEVKVKEIHKMGGGLACMVLPLWRENE